MIRGRIASAFAIASLVVMAFGGCTRERGASPAIETANSPGRAVSLKIKSPLNNSLVRGNVVSIQVEVNGVSIVGADGDASGTTGHFHIFVDRAPVAMGLPVPSESGVIHSADNPVVVPGLSVGDHDFTVVIGDGAHKRISNAVAEVSVKVGGPSVRATVPAEISAGSDLSLAIEVEGISIVAPAQDQGSPGQTGHFHLLIDPPSRPTANGIAIPRDSRNVHTAEMAPKLSGLTPGNHTIWIVVGDRNHVPLDPLVADKVTVSVG